MAVSLKRRSRQFGNIKILVQFWLLGAITVNIHYVFLTYFSEFKIKNLIDLKKIPKFSFIFQFPTAAQWMPKRHIIYESVRNFILNRF